MKYRFISVRQDYPAAKRASFLHVSRSGYYIYTWFSASFSREERENAYLYEVKKIFGESGGTYGPDWIAGVMRVRGRKASSRKVRSRMEREGLRSVHRKKRFRSLTDSRKSRGDGFTNLTKSLEITSLFQVLSSDISYIRTDEGFE